MNHPTEDVSPVGPQMVFGMDAQGRCTFSVGPGLRAQGLEPNELVGQDLLAVYGRDPRGRAALERAMAGEAFTSERVVNGRLLWIYYHPVHAADGSPGGTIGVATDVTDFVQTQEDLVRFKALADASHDLIAIADKDGRAVYANPRVHGLGVTVSAEDLWNTVAEQAGAATVAEMRAVLEAGDRWSGDVTLLAADEPTVVHGQAFRLLGDDGAMLGTAWIGQDITELRASEEALRAANTDLLQFRALVEASGDFIAIAGLDGAVRYVNPAGRELIGMDPDLDATTTTILDYLTPEGIEASLQVEQPAVLEHGHWEGVSTLRNHRGAPIPVEIASFLMRDPETDEPFALATVQRDITERLAVEADLTEMSQQREALLDRLVEAQEAERAQIAADVHDDSIQALAAVDLRLGLLKRQLGERAPELLDVLVPLQDSVSNAIDRLRSLLFDLEPPDLQEGLTGALSRAAEQIFGDTPTRAVVVCEHEPDAPVATRGVAYRIIREAMVNARKHAEATTVTVTVSGRDGALEVSVTDDGAGIANVPPESPPGHHGLSSMRDRAALAGGRVEVTSGPAGGTTVNVWLPASSPVS